MLNQAFVDANAVKLSGTGPCYSLHLRVVSIVSRDPFFLFSSQLKKEIDNIGPCNQWTRSCRNYSKEKYNTLKTAIKAKRRAAKKSRP